MRFLRYFSAISIVLASTANAANGWSGTNLYYAAGLSASQRASYFSSLQSAGMKVLRVWLDGQSTASTKNTPITSYPDLETTAVGSYNDNVLNLLDTFMVDARKYGIKLIISMHSFNALSRPDIYGQWYGTGYFYEQVAATSGFDNRIRHVMNHVHSGLGVAWKNLPNYIFAFEAQNEAMIGKGHQYILDHSGWQCDRAKVIKDTLAGSKILVMTGGASWLDESINDTLLNCAHLDVVSIHAYGTGDYSTSTIQPYVARAVSEGKKLLFQEWGACYYNTPNERCNTGSALDSGTRNSNISKWANAIAAAGVPWLYWQVLPNANPNYDWNYEIGGGSYDPSWSTLVAASKASYSYSSPFDYSGYLP